MMPLPGSRWEVLGTSQCPSSLASCHLLLPQADILALFGASLLQPLAHSTLRSQLEQPPLPKGILLEQRQTAWPEGHPPPRQPQPSVVTPGDGWDRFGLPGARGTDLSLPSHVSHAPTSGTTHGLPSAKALAPPCDSHAPTALISQSAPSPLVTNVSPSNSEKPE